MNLIDLFAIIILFFSLVGGLLEGAVKKFFSLAILLAAIPIAGAYYPLAAIILSFLPGSNWENFIGFFAALAVASLILHLVLFLPSRIIRQLWRGGALYRLLGGLLNLLNTGISLVVFAIIVQVYPVFDWLTTAVAESDVLAWLAQRLVFVPLLLPEALRNLDFFV
ncbi:MAG: CvpA family protein [Chloroflexi bacterium]|nr:CvpA family protein [Chloroflexota bacterium]